MHEVHLVRAIVDTVEKQAAAQGAKRVKLIKIRFNPLTSHSGEHVQFSFEVVKKESALIRGAALALTQTYQDDEVTRPRRRSAAAKRRR